METKDLERALALAKGSILGIDLVPALNHFFFEDGSVTAYNDTTAVIAGLDSGIGCGIKGETLLQLLPTLGKEVEFDSHLGEVDIRSGKMRIKLPTLSVDQCLFEPPPLGFASSIRMTQEAMVGLERCCETVSDNAVQRALSCVYLIVDEEGYMDAFTSNDVALTHFGIPIKWAETKKPFSAMLQGSSCRQLIALCNAASPDDDPILTFGKDWMRAYIGHTTFYSRLVTDATPPDFEAILDRSSPAPQRKIPEGFLTALARAKVLTSKDLTPVVKIRTLVGTLEVSASGVLGEFIETFPLPKDFPTIEVAGRPDALVAASENINTIFGIGKDAISFGADNFHRLVATVRV